MVLCFIQARSVSSFWKSFIFSVKTKKGNALISVSLFLSPWTAGPKGITYLKVKCQYIKNQRDFAKILLK